MGKKNNIKIIVSVLLLVSVLSAGVYYIYNKNKSKSSNGENGSAISGYVIADGAVI